MGYRKNLDYHLICQQILDVAKTPKSAYMLCQELGLKEYTIYRALSLMQTTGHLNAQPEFHPITGKKTRMVYTTVIAQYLIPEIVRANLPTVGARVISFDNPSMRKLLAETSQLTRQERKSPRVNVGISTVYNG